jgi:predicted AAA+ superfamily ATPase
LGRIIVFTGARQTGKTTLVKHLFPDFEYLSIEDPVLRKHYAKLTAAEWAALYPAAILDEVQKEPALIESIKSVYDQMPEPRYILLGSSRLLLLEKVKESLAGRCVIVELFPLTLPELLTKSWQEAVEFSLFQKFILEPHAKFELFPSFLLDKKLVAKKAAWEHYVKFGGYPALTKKEMDDDERYRWLSGYVKTYLERDIRDLASFRDLEPFIKLQRYLALQTGQLINASSIAVQLGISVKTVQRYIRYFELSYQAIIVPAWSANLNKRLAKSPKLHYMDNGVLQAVLQKNGGLTGAEFESLVVAEIYKQLRCIGAQVNMYHFRTHDGFEVDLLLETQDGYFAFEIKMNDKIRREDASRLKKLPALLDKPVLGSFIISNDTDTKELAPGIKAVNAAYFLG